MAYGIVITVDNKQYLEVNKDFSIKVFHEWEDAVAKFDAFRSKYWSGDYESYISSGMGIIFLHPLVIELPNDPNSLKEYFVKDTVSYLEGSGFGYFIDTIGIEVSKSIEELTIIEIAKDIIHDSRNYQR